MKVSPAGRAAIMRREGCKLVAYRDSRGIPTIGVGHVDMTPPKTVMGMRITQAQADALLAADLAPVEATIASAVKMPLSQNECDALASLGFNIGVGGLRKSTVVGRLNRGDRAGAAQAFLLWAHPSELMGRRKEEAKQFLTPDLPPQAGEGHPAPPSPPAPTPLPTRPPKGDGGHPAKAPTSAKPAPATPAPARPSLVAGALAGIASLFGR